MPVLKIFGWHNSVFSNSRTFSLFVCAVIIIKQSLNTKKMLIYVINFTPAQTVIFSAIESLQFMFQLVQRSVK